MGVSSQVYEQLKRHGIPVAHKPRRVSAMTQKMRLVIIAALAAVTVLVVFGWAHRSSPAPAPLTSLPYSGVPATAPSLPAAAPATLAAYDDRQPQPYPAYARRYNVRTVRAAEPLRPVVYEERRAVRRGRS